MVMTSFEFCVIMYQKKKNYGAGNYEMCECNIQRENDVASAREMHGNTMDVHKTEKQ